MIVLYPLIPLLPTRHIIPSPSVVLTSIPELAPLPRLKRQHGCTGTEHPWESIFFRPREAITPGHGYPRVFGFFSPRRWSQELGNDARYLHLNKKYPDLTGLPAFELQYIFIIQNPQGRFAIWRIPTCQGHYCATIETPQSSNEPFPREVMAPN